MGTNITQLPTRFFRAHRHVHNILMESISVPQYKRKIANNTISPLYSQKGESLLLTLSLAMGAKTQNVNQNGLHTIYSRPRLKSVSLYTSLNLLKRHPLAIRNIYYLPPKFSFRRYNIYEALHHHNIFLQRKIIILLTDVCARCGSVLLKIVEDILEIFE